MTTANMYEQLINKLNLRNVNLIAVSKTKPNEAILNLYSQGQRDFGENKVQEMTLKQEALPKDIRWHMIGHLQSNKVKYIAPFVHMIHSVDSIKLLKEINKQAQKADRTIKCLLQFKIADEDSKYGLSWNDAEQILSSEWFESMKHVEICGVMGMATNTNSTVKIKQEFETLSNIFRQLKQRFFPHQDSFCEKSMGMSADYEVAIEAGSTMVRIGSMLFGQRVYA